ncbi:MAG: signal peptidase I, partial [Myxococcales bacterium]|nr:signal peptidase I [Myxococcales bacterium]
MRAVICAVLSFFLPGLGDGVTGRYRSMALWVAGAAGVVVLSALSIWLVPMTIAIRVSAMIGGFRGVRAADRAGVRTHWLGVLLTVGLHAVLSVVLKGLVIEAFAIPSTSMAPTLAIGDHIFAEKLTLPARGVARGDVVVFRHPCTPSRDYIQRVIALGGETIEIRCNVVHVNGAPLASTLVQGAGCSYDDRDERDGSWHAQACSEYAEVAGAHTYAIYHDAERPARDASPSHGGADPRDFPFVDGTPRVPS